MALKWLPWFPPFIEVPRASPSYLLTVRTMKMFRLSRMNLITIIFRHNKIQWHWSSYCFKIQQQPAFIQEWNLAIHHSNTPCHLGTSKEALQAETQPDRPDCHHLNYKDLSPRPKCSPRSTTTGTANLRNPSNIKPGAWLNCPLGN